MDRIPQLAGSSRVRNRESDLIAGVANRTIGSIMTHETSQDTSQSPKKLPVPRSEKLAIPAAINDVNPRSIQLGYGCLLLTQCLREFRV